MLTKSQLKARKKGITGSDVAKLLGVSPFGGDFDVYMGKTEDGYETVMSEPMYWGHEHEPTIAKHYGKTHQVDLKECETMVHPNHSIWMGTPDRIVLKGGHVTKGLEIKSTGAFRAKDWGEQHTDQVPLHYLCQVMWYMPLIDVNEMDFAILIGGNQYREYTVKRDDELLEMMWSKAEFFWRHHVEKRNPPNIDGSDSCKEFLTNKYDSPSRNIVESTPRTDDLAVSLKHTRDQLKILDTKKKSLENLIKDEIGNNLSMQGKDFKATWSSYSGRKSVDWQSVVGTVSKCLIDEMQKNGVSKEECESIVSSLVDESVAFYTREKKQRTFRFTWHDDSKKALPKPKKEETHE